MKRDDYVAWKDEGKWVVHSPSVPGVYGLGSTRKRAEQDFIEALRALLDHLRSRVRGDKGRRE
jgi:predicted RNase H-like HicB family nuclease